MTGYEVGDVGGLQVYSVPPREGTVTARLTFRAGSMDGTLQDGAVRPIIGRLAMESLPPTVACQVELGPTTTSFTVHDTPELVLEGIERLTGWLTDPDLADLPRVRAAIAEGAYGREANAVDRALHRRFGASGPGLAAADRHLTAGLVTPERIIRQLGELFTADNAVLALQTRTPEAVRHSLPLTSTAPRPLPPLPPHHKGSRTYTLSEGDASIALMVPREEGAVFLRPLLQRHLTERLRLQAGVAYAPWSAYVRVSPDQALLIGGSDVFGEFRDVLIRHLLGALDDIADAVHPEWLDELKAQALTQLDDPRAALGEAVSAAESYLLGEPIRSRDEYVQVVTGVTHRGIALCLRAGYPDIDLEIPEGTTLGDAVRARPDRATLPTGYGRHFRPLRDPLRQDEVWIAEDALLVSRQRDEVIMAPFADVVGMYRWPDGRRCLVTRDGRLTAVEADLVAHGQAMVAELDRKVDPALWIPQEPRAEEDRPRVFGWRRYLTLLLQVYLLYPLGLTKAVQPPLLRVHKVLWVLLPMLAALLLAVLLPFSLQARRAVFIVGWPLLMILLLKFRLRRF